MSTDSKRRLSPWLIAAIVVGLLVAGYVGAALLVQGTIPRNTTVVGVDIGGLNPQQATQVLEDELGPLAAEPLPVALEGTRADIDPAQAGLSFNAAATTSRLVGFSLSPARLWSHVAGGGAATPIVDVDEDALNRTLEAIADDFGTPPVNGNIEFVDAQPRKTQPEEGTEVAIPAAAGKIAQQWLTGSRPLTLPAVSVAPQIDEEELNRAMTEDAEPLVAGPIKVEVGEEAAELDTQVLAKAAAFKIEGERLVLELNGEELAENIRSQIPGLESGAKNASITLVDGAPKVHPAKVGAEVDEQVLVEDVLAATQTEERTISVQFREVEPTLTTEAAEALGVKEEISSFSTSWTGDAVRTENLRNGASKINDVLVLPGETFSLLDTLGPITAENGFGNAGILVDGILTEGMGGGLSQLATTLYNAIFFSGLEVVEHMPHSQYFSRYPEVRESTIFVPDIDVKFKNDSDYGVLIQSWVADGQVHAAFWSTKVWDIESVNSGRSEVVQPTQVTRSGSHCRPSSPGNPGFLATVERQFYKDGEYVKSESYTWRYEPQNGVTCE